MNIKELVRWSETIEDQSSKILEYDIVRKLVIDNLEKDGITEIFQPHTRHAVHLDSCDLYSLVYALQRDARTRGIEQGFQQGKGAYLR